MGWGIKDIKNKQVSILISNINANIKIKRNTKVKDFQNLKIHLSCPILILVFYNDVKQPIIHMHK